MKIIYPYFDNSTTDYARLRNVFEKSARRHMPDVELVCVELEPARADEDKHDLTTRAFLAKTESKYLKETALIADADLFFTDSIAFVFDKLLQRVGITARIGYKYPYNSGAIYYTYPNEEKINYWRDKTKSFYSRRNEKGVRDLVKANGGFDQAVLASIATYFVQMPCEIYNACQGDWKNTDQQTKVYHIKSGLRKIVLDPKKEHGELYLKAHPRVQEIARMWWAEEDK